VKIYRSTWLIFFILSVISCLAWYRFNYPHLDFINLSINRKQALQISDNYLTDNGVDVSTYKKAIVFQSEKRASRFLQKAVGFDNFKKFLQEHNFDMFFWMVRYFKENEKEQYRVVISSSTGEVTSFKHVIENNEVREPLEKEEAKERVKSFLAEKFHYDFEHYTIQVDLEHIRDNRSDFTFSWKAKSVDIPWSEKKDAGTGKLLTGATISGDEILTFSKQNFTIPEKFNRHIAEQRNIGKNLSTVVRIFYYIFFTASIFFVIARRNHLAMHLTKRFYITIIAFSFLLSIISSMNQIQIVLFNYNTISPFIDAMGRYAVNVIIGGLLATLTIVLPSLSGELLRYEVFKLKHHCSFLHNILSSFFTRVVAQQICFGYFVFLIMLGMQAVLFHLGQKYFGVWVEYHFMNSLSTAYFPFIVAFTIGFKASFTEEIFYRIFAISWGKKIFKNTVVAVIVSSLIWGFSHSQYPIFPMWFRGVEVTCLGLFLSYMFLRFGIIPVIVGHYLFDAFWNSAGYIMGETEPLYFWSCLAVLLLPIILSIIAFIANRSDEPRPMRWRLNKHQIYNLGILKEYLHYHPEIFTNRSKSELKKEISSHGWDIAVVDMAIEDHWGGGDVSYKEESS